ncbi:MAG: signal peptidase II [Nitriliruptor sp.]|nr:MAG: signal peptidase II [Nitriliruptor sp.]
MRRDADLTVEPASAADAPLPRPRRSVAVGLGVAAVFVVLDQVTKAIAENALEPGRFVPWLGPNVGWQLVYNPGGAFGLPAPSWIFLVVTVLVVVIVARALPRTSSLWQAGAYGLLLSGAIGNVIDRLVRDGGPDAPSFGGGEVVDFVAWGTFPRFNVADSAITVGFALLVLTLWRDERRTEGPAAEEPVAEDPPIGEDVPDDPGPDRPTG